MDVGLQLPIDPLKLAGSRRQVSGSTDSHSDGRTFRITNMTQIPYTTTFSGHYRAHEHPSLNDAPMLTESFRSK